MEKMKKNRMKMSNWSLAMLWKWLHSRAHSALTIYTGSLSLVFIDDEFSILILSFDIGKQIFSGQRFVLMRCYAVRSVEFACTLYTVYFYTCIVHVHEHSVQCFQLHTLNNVQCSHSIISMQLSSSLTWFVQQ